MISDPSAEVHLQTGIPEVVVMAWLASLRSANTRAAYGSDLTRFREFLTAEGWPEDQVSRPVVDAFATSMEHADLSPATIARRLSALASFYDYCLDAGLIAASPVDRVKRPTVAGDSPRLGLDRDEAAALLDAAESGGPRDHALVCLLLLNGLRVSEALGLTLADLDEERGHRIIRIKGKGGRTRTAPLAPRTQDAIAAQVGSRSDGALLLGEDGEAMNRHQAARAVRRLARAAGITKTISPHSLRHTMVTISLDAGVPLHVVQDAAGHLSPETTRRYDRARHALDGHATYALAQHLA